MGFWGGRHLGEGKEIHKWQYINLSDFKTSSCPTVFSYIWLWGLACTSVAVYAVDTFTAINLLAFNKWSSGVTPVINLEIAKWIFVGCILASWALCIYEWVRAIMVMKQESVTEDFLDPLAVVLQSIKIPGGWRRFLVFAELTKSNKKATWVAVYVYFERKGCLRILAAEGPRNVLNALTIYSVARADLGSTSDSTFIHFFQNIKTLFETRRQEGILLASMTFTFVIWVFSMLMLLLALLLWIFYISHHVNKETLTGYCRRKVETKLSKIIKDKTDKIWAKAEADREKQAREALKNGAIVDESEIEAIKRQPTLPVFGMSPPDKGSFMTHNVSVPTLPRYNSKSADDELPPMPTQYSGKESLLGNTAPMGQSYSMSRPETAATQRSYGSHGARYMPPLSNNDSYNTYNSYSDQPSRAESPHSSFESNRRYSPQSTADNASWRNNAGAYDEQQAYEMQQPTIPGAMRPGNGRNISQPTRNQMPYQQPIRNMTAPPGAMGGPPRPGTSQSNLPRAMAPAFGAGLPRSMTPGAQPDRSHTPGQSSISSQYSGVPPSYRSQAQTPGAQSMRSQQPGPPTSYRSRTPASRPNPYSMDDNSRSGAPGSAL